MDSETVLAKARVILSKATEPTAELTTRHFHSAIADILKGARPILRQMPRPALNLRQGEALIPSASTAYRELGQPTLR